MFLIFLTDIMLYNPLNLILTTNKLTSPNFLDWQRNLDIVHTLEELKVGNLGNHSIFP